MKRNEVYAAVVATLWANPGETKSGRLAQKSQHTFSKKKHKKKIEKKDEKKTGSAKRPTNAETSKAKPVNCALTSYVTR